ncbi:MAG: DMT family transporter [Dehalococcoidia bacterium]|nr:MAG: DMT family transporter [Dehalococcoidia bacterium]
MGEAAALASAVTWAGTSVILARLGVRYAAPVLSSLRLLAATPFILLLVIVTGSESQLRDAPTSVLFAMVASGLVGYGLGDTTYIRSMGRFGVQRMAPPTTALWVALSAAGGIWLLDEPFSWGLIAGGALVVGGTWFIVAQSAATVTARAAEALAAAGAGMTAPAPSTPLAILAIVAVALAWTVATLVLAGGRGDLGAPTAGLVRIPAGGLAIGLAVSVGTRGTILRRLPRGRDLALIGALGILGTGMGSVLYIFAVAEAGVARATVLNSTSPLLALPLSMLILRERPTGRIGIGTVFCVAGTATVLLT